MTAGGHVVRAFRPLHQHHQRHPPSCIRVCLPITPRQLAGLGALTGLVMSRAGFTTRPCCCKAGFNPSIWLAPVVYPLLVLITIGSIINGRLISRPRRPERLIAYGQIPLPAGCALLVQMHVDSPHVFVMFAFGVCGLALGFQLPNLT